MNRDKFNNLLDEIDGTSLTTLKEKNAKYAPCEDALHNFHVGARLDGSTTAQTIWHYAKKHAVALLDKIERDDWSDREDVKEKVQDLMNYLRFIWCAANDIEEESQPVICETELNLKAENICYECSRKCKIEERGCICCKHIGKNEYQEPCASCKVYDISQKTRLTNWESYNS